MVSNSYENLNRDRASPPFTKCTILNTISRDSRLRSPSKTSRRRSGQTAEPSVNHQREYTPRRDGSLRLCPAGRVPLCGHRREPQGRLSRRSPTIAYLTLFPDSRHRPHLSGQLRLLPSPGRFDYPAGSYRRLGVAVTSTEMLSPPPPDVPPSQFTAVIHVTVSLLSRHTSSKKQFLRAQVGQGGGGQKKEAVSPGSSTLSSTADP